MGMALAVAGCGGGGGGGGGIALPLLAPPPASQGNTQAHPDIVPVSSVAGRCVSPRTRGGYADRPGTLTDEKRWVRSWIDETYLWYDEVPGLRAADYATPVAYFDVLRTSAVTASGRPKDRFHFTYDTAAYEVLTQSGAPPGYGITFAFVRSVPPRDVRVAYVEDGSPAAAAGVTRGMQLVGVDGLDAAGTDDVEGLNAGLAPAGTGEQHVLQFRDLDDNLRDFRLTSAQVGSRAVQNVRTLPAAGGPVGYMQFNAHQPQAEAQLMDAIEHFKRDAVTDLVVDMRYNGGGLLGIASELAYMIAPANATRGQTFERLQFNRKNPFNLTEAQASMAFFSTAGYGERSGRPLPQLGLPRVTVLTGPDTCSASEALVNGLRGVGVQVDLVGGTTCGKPYGYLPTDNCGTTYFAIQFQGVNARGFGDYADGFAPTCAVPDDFSQALGDPAEGRLAAALYLRENGQCPSATLARASASAQAAAGGAAMPEEPLLRRSPVLENRVLDLRELQREQP